MIMNSITTYNKLQLIVMKTMCVISHRLDFVH